MLHPLLQRQLKKLGVADPWAVYDERFAKLLEHVNRTYVQSDQERYTLERSLSLSAEETQELHKKVEKQNRILHQVLNRYVSEEVAADILSNPEEKLKLGGSTRLLTILFADIRNYTGFAKSKDAQLIIQTLNKIFERVVPVIFEEHGTLDKFMGDAVMAFYGAPVSQDDDAMRAVRTAVKMQNAIRQLRQEDPSLSEIAFGAGLYTGYAVVGNLGSHRLMNYTCIGDAANSAKRLQEHAKADQILIDSVTYEAVLDAVEVRPTEPLMLKGKKSATIAYEVLGLK